MYSLDRAAVCRLRLMRLPKIIVSPWLNGSIQGSKMFNKIKQTLGFVGIEVQLEVPSDIPKDDSVVEGKVRVIAKADQTITKVSLKMVEHWERGKSGKDYESRDFDLG